MDTSPVISQRRPRVESPHCQVWGPTSARGTVDPRRHKAPPAPQQAPLSLLFQKTSPSRLQWSPAALPASPGCPRLHQVRWVHPAAGRVTQREAARLLFARGHSCWAFCLRGQILKTKRIHPGTDTLSPGKKSRQNCHRGQLPGSQHSPPARLPPCTDSLACRAGTQGGLRAPEAVCSLPADLSD